MNLIDSQLSKFIKLYCTMLMILFIIGCSDSFSIVDLQVVSGELIARTNKIPRFDKGYNECYLVNSKQEFVAVNERFCEIKLSQFIDNLDKETNSYTISSEFKDHEDVREFRFDIKKL